jgi:hypothetical protein
LERFVSTAILGFAVSEVAGRFRERTPAEIDDDFAFVLGMLEDQIRRLAEEGPHASRDRGKGATRVTRSRKRGHTRDDIAEEGPHA